MINNQLVCFVYVPEDSADDTLRERRELGGQGLTEMSYKTSLNYF